MKPEHRKYIRENAGRKSVEEMARALGVKEKKIRKFLEKDKPEKAAPISMKEKAAVRVDKKVFLQLAIIAIVGFAIYFNSLNGEFLWDDYHLVKRNTYIQDWSHTWDIFTKHVGAGAQRTYHFYRPIQILSFALDYSLWKSNVIGYHLTNVLLHILVALCVFWLVAVLFGDKLSSFLAALLFVAHPLHTEAVSYISGRADPLAALFLLISFIFYVKNSASPRPAYLALSLSAYAFALLSRENTLILPFLLLLYHAAFRRKVDAAPFLSITALAGAYIFLRMAVFRFMLPENIGNATAIYRLPGTFVAVTNYLGLIILPLNLHMGYGRKLFSWLDPRTFLGFVIIALFLAMAVKIRKRDNLVFFSIWWFFIALVPFSNIIYPINAYMAEHWLYLPSVGFFLLLSKGLRVLYEKKGFRIFAVVLAAGILSFYSLLTFQQNKSWRDPFLFYTRMLKYVSDSAEVYNNLGVIYGDRKDYEKAIALFKESIKVDPAYADPYFNLGKAYSESGRKEEAIKYYLDGIGIYEDPVAAETYYNIGILYNDLGKSEEAIAAYKKALSINPRYVYAYNNLGLAYHNIGNDEEAMKLFTKAIEIDLKDPYAYNSMAIVYYEKGDYKQAIFFCDKAKSLGLVNEAFLEALKPYR